eukprot:jgi/Botrbrau1/14207/Bobra.0291s0012.1
MLNYTPYIRQHVAMRVINNAYERNLPRFSYTCRVKHNMRLARNWQTESVSTTATPFYRRVPAALVVHSDLVSYHVRIYVSTYKYAYM